MDQNERVKELTRLVAMLPVSNYSLLRAMSAHLIRIVQNCQVNKMTVRNVGIVFSPTLSIPAGVFSMLLTEFEKVFNVQGNNEPETDDDDKSSVGSYGEVIAPTKGKERVRRPKEKPAADGARHSSKPVQKEKVSRRNSTLYANTSADQMLGLAGRKLESELIGTNLSITIAEDC